MEAIAISKSVRISPRKVRLVADTVRNMSALKALRELSLIRKRPSVVIAKTIQSAIANAVHNTKLNKDRLMIKSIEISEGAALKRFHPSTRGRVHPYKKRSSTIRVIVKEGK